MAKKIRLVLLVALLPLVSACVGSAASQVAGRATAEPVLITTTQADEYLRDARATVDRREQEARELALEMAVTSAAATTAAQYVQSQATATAAAVQTSSAVSLVMTTDAATVQAGVTATRQAYLDAIAASEVQGTATAAVIAVTRQVYEMQQEQAKAARQQAWTNAMTAGLVVLGLMLASAIVYGAWRIVPTIINRASVIRYGAHKNPLIITATSSGQTVVTDPMRMLQPAIRIGTDGGMTIPDTTSEEAQAFVVATMMRFLERQLDRPPNGQQALLSETTTERSRNVGGIHFNDRHTQRYVPPPTSQSLPIEQGTIPQFPIRVSRPEATQLAAPNTAPPQLPDTPPISALPSQATARAGGLETAQSPTMPNQFPMGAAQTPAVAVRPPQVSAARQPDGAPSALSFIVDALRQNRIFLGLEDGVPITVGVRELCHVAIAGPTNGGKTTLLRLLLAQVLASGARVIMADPHYAPVDPNNGDDWRAIGAYLHKPPARRRRDIRLVFESAVKEMDARLEARSRGQGWSDCLFLVFDELPVITRDLPDVVVMLARILREGRKVGVFVMGAFQDILVKSIGGDSAVRSCYRTAYCLDADPITLRVLMNVRGYDGARLQRGVALLRASDMDQAREVAIPRLTNGEIEQLLPPSERQGRGMTPDEPAVPSGQVLPVIPGSRPEVVRGSNAGSRPEVTTGSRPEVTNGSSGSNTGSRPEVTNGGSGSNTGSGGSRVIGESLESRIVRLLESGASQNSIIRQLFGENVRGGRPYQNAAKVIKSIQERMPQK